jgi:hypothetical protein
LQASRTTTTPERVWHRTAPLADAVHMIVQAAHTATIVALAVHRIMSRFLPRL